MKKIALLSIFILSLSSCSMFSNKKQDPSDAYVTGLGLEKGVASNEVVSELVKNESMGGGDYQIEIYPYTKPLVESLAREHSLTKGLALTKLLPEYTKQLLIDRNCFQFNIRVKTHEEAKSVLSWRLNLIDSHEHVHSLNWIEESSWKVPVVTKVASYQGEKNEWISQGVACSEIASELQKGFFVEMIPSYVGWPFPEKFRVQWTFDQYKMIDGKRTLIKKSKKVIKPYRNW